MIDLDRIEALANAATPGPWTTAPDPGCGEVCDCGETCSREDHALIARSAAPTVGLAVVLAEERDEANAAFIAAAREDIPALVAELRAARAEIERLRTAAADERADVVAAGQDVVTRLHARNDDKESHAAYTLGAFLSLVVEGKHEGAHVGAAKGGERG